MTTLHLTLTLLALAAFYSCNGQMNLNTPGSDIPVVETISLGSVEPQYEVAPNWNDYFINSDPTRACTGTEIDCEHGGELKKISVFGTNSCLGLTMVDALSAFDWTCEAGSQVTFNGKLKPTASVANLVAATSWIPNSVVVLKNGIQKAATTPGVWFSNPVMPLPDATSATQILSTAGVVYVAAATPSGMIRGYNINADKIAVAIKPGVTLSSAGVANTDGSTKKYNPAGVKTIFAIGSQKFASIEGSYDWAFGVRPTYWVLEGEGANVNYALGLAYSKYLRIKRLSIRNSTSNLIHSQTLFGSVLDRVTLADAGSYGTAEGTTLFGKWTNINAFSMGRALIDLNGPAYTLFENIYTKDHTIQLFPGFNAGIWMNGANYMTFKNVVILNSNCTGMAVRNTSNSTFTNMTISNSGSSGAVTCGAEGGNGLHTASASNNIYRSLKVYSSAGSGISIIGGTNQIFKGVISTNNGYTAAFTGKAGIRETGSGTNMIYSNVLVSNNGAEGMSLSNAGSTVSQVIATHNGTSGISIGAATKAISAATVAYNGTHGIEQLFTNASTIYHNVLALKNTQSGIYIANDSVGPTLSNISSLSNLGYGVQIGTASAPPAIVKVVGNLLLSDNSTGLCLLPASVNGLSSTSGCSVSAPSTGTITDLGGTVVNGLNGPVTNDNTNTSELSGQGPYSSISDWGNFENTARSWGRLDPLLGACIVGGETCQVWDWRLKSTDTFIKNTTYDAQTQNDPFVSQAVCPTNLSGSHFETSIAGSINFLRLAIEDMSSAFGNKNGLCENGEECLYTPNFGAYQGSGGLSACVFDDEGAAVDVLRMSSFSVQ